MGSNQSDRSTHFHRPSPDAKNAETDPEPDDDRHISISNKMVERLVEDATLAGGAAAAVAAATGRGAKPFRGDYKETVLIERLKCLDDRHSERYGLTIQDMNSLAKRIELRTATMVSVDPVCEESAEKVIECYNSYGDPEETIRCWESVGAFTNCVKDASAARLRERTERDALERARRTKHVALAREHALKDLGAPPQQETLS